MALADIEAVVPATRKGPTCSIARIRAQYEEDDLATLDRWLTDEEAYSVSRTSRLLVAAGHHVAQQTVARHRRGECMCGR